jgi:hypothetical protein
MTFYDVVARPKGGKMTLLDRHRELDVHETKLTIIRQWPFEAQLEFLRDQLRERVQATEEQTKRINEFVDRMLIRR